jgi:hypothetical protein
MAGHELNPNRDVKRVDGVRITPHGPAGCELQHTGDGTTRAWHGRPHALGVRCSAPGRSIRGNAGAGGSNSSDFWRASHLALLRPALRLAMCSCKHCRLSAQSLWARFRAASSFGPHRGITCTPSRVAAISSALLRPLRGSPCACSSPRPRRPSPGDDARGRRLGNSLLYNLSSYLSRTSDLRSKIGATSSIIKLRPRTSPAGSASDISLASFTPSAHGLGGRPARATTRPPPG